jgi:hypothetical protein
VEDSVLGVGRLDLLEKQIPSIQGCGGRDVLPVEHRLMEAMKGVQLALKPYFPSFDHTIERGAFPDCHYFQKLTLTESPPPLQLGSTPIVIDNLNNRFGHDGTDVLNASMNLGFYIWDTPIIGFAAWFHLIINLNWILSTEIIVENRL